VELERYASADSREDDSVVKDKPVVDDLAKDKDKDESADDDSAKDNDEDEPMTDEDSDDESIQSDQTEYDFTITATNEDGQEMFSMEISSEEPEEYQLINNTNFGINDTVTMNLEVRYSKMKDQRVNAVIKKICEKHLSMLNDPKSSDFTCIVANRSFKVHKAILGAASPVFDRMFSTAMAEAQSNEAKIDAIDPNIFEHLLRFIYGGKLPENFVAVAVDLFKAAHYYEIEELKEICEDEIEEKLSKGNAIQFYELAYVYDLKVLKENIWEFVKR
jgi:hypothetical protein